MKWKKIFGLWIITFFIILLLMSYNISVNAVKTHDVKIKGGDIYLDIYGGIYVHLITVNGTNETIISHNNVSGRRLLGGRWNDSSKTDIEAGMSFIRGYCLQPKNLCLFSTIKATVTAGDQTLTRYGFCFCGFYWLFPFKIEDGRFGLYP